MADVLGTHRYATRISVEGRGRDLSKRLEAACSCPVGDRCKHGVAVILEFLNAIENGTAVPATDDNDRRLTLIENGWEDEFSYGEFDETDFDSIDETVTKNRGRSTAQKSGSRKNRPSLTSLAREVAKLN